MAKFKKHQKIDCDDMFSAVQSAYEQEGVSFNNTLEKVIESPEDFSTVPIKVFDAVSRSVSLLTFPDSTSCVGEIGLIDKALDPLSKAQKLYNDLHMEDWKSEKGYSQSLKEYASDYEKYKVEVECSSNEKVVPTNELKTKSDYRSASYALQRCTSDMKRRLADIKKEGQKREVKALQKAAEIKRIEKLALAKKRFEIEMQETIKTKCQTKSKYYTSEWERIKKENTKVKWLEHDFKNLRASCIAQSW